VDDEDQVRRATARTLERAGFRVLPAADGEAALALIDGGATPDAVVTDMMMPGMDGAALVRVLRERRPGLPALIVSGYADGGVPRDLLDQPGTSWLTKPYTPAQLSAGVVSLLG
jgi:two-component system cell cycle sensor histidine kinase/response regulator CckA